MKKLWLCNYECKLAVPYLSSTELFVMQRSQLKIHGFSSKAETIQYFWLKKNNFWLTQLGTAFFTLQELQACC